MTAEDLAFAVRCDVDAERYVLGAVMLSAGRVLDTLATRLRPEDFYRPAHEELWHRFMTMHGRGEPLEPTAVGAALDHAPVRGVERVDLHTLCAACSTTTNADFYADKIRKLARLRRLSAAGVKIAQTADAADPAEAEEVYAACRGIVDDAGADIASGELADFGTLMMDALDRWDSPEVGITPTGISDVDNMMLGGLRPGHLVIVASRPSVGKSFVASNIARQTARRGFGSYMASLEMTSGEFVDRIVSDEAGVNLTRLTKRELDPGDWERVARAHRDSAEWPLTVDDRSNLSVAAIQARARDIGRRSGNLRTVIVDYLQLVAPEDKRANRQEQVAGISRGLKLLARDMGVTVIALAQLNRGSTMRADKRPVMSDLRESGGIEADADEIILLHRDDAAPGIIEFIFGKNRHGESGTLKLSWQPSFARIAPLARPV